MTPVKLSMTPTATTTNAEKSRLRFMLEKRQLHSVSEIHHAHGEANSRLWWLLASVYKA